MLVEVDRELSAELSVDPLIVDLHLMQLDTRRIATLTPIMSIRRW